jgi:hypothetical protein
MDRVPVPAVAFDTASKILGYGLGGASREERFAMVEAITTDENWKVLAAAVLQAAAECGVARAGTP